MFELYIIAPGQFHGNMSMQVYIWTLCEYSKRKKQQQSGRVITSFTSVFQSFGPVSCKFMQ